MLAVYAGLAGDEFLSYLGLPAQTPQNIAGCTTEIGGGGRRTGHDIIPGSIQLRPDPLRSCASFISQILRDCQQH